MADIKYLDMQQFRDFGYVQEVNRRFLHPLGLALEWRDGWTKEGLATFLKRNGIQFGEDAQECIWTFIVTHGIDKPHLGGVWDYRSDPEGVYFVLQTDEQSEEFIRKAALVKVEWHTRKHERQAELGYMVQPYTHMDEEIGSDICLLMGRALAREFTFFKGTEATYTKVARGVLDKLCEAVSGHPYDPEAVTPEEVHIIDLLLGPAAVSGVHSRAEAVNALQNELAFWKERAKVSEEAIGAISKVRGLDETKQMRDIAEAATSTLVAMIGG